MPEMTPVESSLIAAVGFDDEKAELYVEFKKGGLYSYQDVPKAVYTAMLNAKSVGKFFLENVKSQYKYSKYDKVGA